MLDDVETVTVDSYTTLVDVDAQAGAIEARIDGVDDREAAAISRLWRSKAIGYTMVANDVDAYRPFYDLQGRALGYALEMHGHDVPAGTREEIRRAVYLEDLSVFEDVRPGLERIADSRPVYVLSNGDPGMLDSLVDAADLGDVIAGTISADEIERYKPESAIYRHAADRTGTPIGAVLHASGGSMRDVWGASHAGMRTAWVNRPEKPHPRESLGADPDVVVEGFRDLADRLP